MRRLLGDPLVGFAAAAVGVFLLFAALGEERSDPTRTIEITGDDIDRLKESFEAVWLRAPSYDELRTLIEERVRDEIFYREALLMGLDRDDTVVRRRMRQALELMVDGLHRGRPPTEDELEAHLRANPDRYRAESKVSFRQVFFSREKRGAEAESDASKLLEQLKAPGGSPAAVERGDATLLPAEEVDARASDIAAQFGQAFSEALAESPEGEWTGPIESPYGVHLVRVDRLQEGGIPPLADVLEAVLRDFEAARAEAAEEQFFDSLLSRYTAVLEPEKPRSR